MAYVLITERLDHEGRQKVDEVLAEAGMTRRDRLKQRTAQLAALGVEVGNG